MSQGHLVDPLLAVPRVVGARQTPNIGNRYPLAPIQMVRPNDVTQYAIGDVFGDLIHLPNIRRVAGASVSLGGGFALETTKASHPGFGVWVFSAQPDARADNAPLAGTLSDAENASLLGVGAISGATNWTTAFGVTRTGNGGNWLAQGFSVGVTQTVLQESTVMPVTAGRDLWLYLAVANNVYTPDALERLTLWLFSENHT